jgi:hydantoinase/carbamoylase family amidase
MELTINRARLKERLMRLAEIGKLGDTGVCRLALSKEDRQAVGLVKSWFEEAGLAARIDHFGNLIGRMEGRNPEAPVLMMGSHIDSQPYGGRFDGTVGVLGALEAAQTMRERGLVPETPIEIVSFCDEEGCRFNKGLFGVRGILGRLEEGELERTDKNGVTRRQALIEFGCDPERFGESVYKPGSIGAYLEMHIEQGPVLEALGQPVGIVTGIAGPLWLTVTLTGVAGHAGSVPMRMRKDALVGAARIILALREIASRDPDAPTVGTVGSVKVFPDSRNIIPERVELTIDLRDIDLDRRNRLEAELMEAIRRTAEECGFDVRVREDTNRPPRYCAAWIKEAMRRNARRMGLEPPELMSGPFHDALEMSYACDYGMIFVRCREGISHSPREFAAMDDIALGAELLYRTAVDMARAAGEPYPAASRSDA